MIFRDAVWHKDVLAKSIAANHCFCKQSENGIFRFAGADSREDLFSASPDKPVGS
jgi:hypothetical protein